MKLPPEMQRDPSRKFAALSTQQNSRPTRGTKVFQYSIHSVLLALLLRLRKPTLKPAAKVAFTNNTSGNDTSGVEISEDEEAGSDLPSMVSANTVSLLEEMKLTGGQETQNLVAKLEESIQNDDSRRMYEMGKAVNAPRHDELSDGDYW